MSRPRSSPDEITPEMLLRAYAAGIFPMAESADDPGLFWLEPEKRGIIPLDGLVVTRSLAKVVRQDRFTVTVDQDFDAVIAACSASTPDRKETWINARIRRLYGDLFRMGHVHTVECRREGVLVGGLYGVSLGAAFFGESMFHRERDASKVALVHLVARLRLGGFVLLDTQFVTEHLATLGAVEISRARYRRAVADATRREAVYVSEALPPRLTGAEALAALPTPPSAGS